MLIHLMDIIAQKGILMKNKFSAKAAVAVIAAFSLAAPVASALLITPQTTVQAANGDLGPDWSKYQGMSGRFAQASDEFVIAQVGGTYGGRYIDQPTYKTQVAAAIAAGKRAHVHFGPVWWLNHTGRAGA
jgi:hypothetical protein